MKSFRLTPAAEDDLFEIWSFIAENNLPAADQVEVDLLNACGEMAILPIWGAWAVDPKC